MAVRNVSTFNDIGGGVCNLWVDVAANGRISSAGCDNNSVNAIYIQVISAEGVQLADVVVSPGEHPIWNVPANQTWQGSQIIARYPA